MVGPVPLLVIQSVSVFHLAQVLYAGPDPAEAVALDFTGSVTAIAGSGDAGGLEGRFYATSRATSGMLRKGKLSVHVLSTMYS
jgi:hypothetical protein